MIKEKFNYDISFKTEGQKKREEVHADVFEQRYIFRTNATKENLPEILKNIRKEGLEPIVRDEAFIPDGKENPIAVTVYVRKPEKGN